MHRILVTVGLALTLGLAGCGSLNPFKSTSKTQPHELKPIQTSLNVRKLWSANLDGGETLFLTPVIVDDFVYAAGGDGTIVKIELATGRTVLRVSAGQPISAGVGADGRTIAVVGTSGELIALEESGKVRWKTQTNGEVLSVPVVGGGLIVVRTIDQRLLAYDVETGKRSWIYQRQSQPLVLRTGPGMAIANDMLYSGFAGGRLIALTLANGGQRWDVSVAIPRGATELERVADVVGTPRIDNREVCVATYQGRAGCFDADRGAAIWTREISTSTGIGIDASYAFVTDDKSVIQGYARGTGTSLWRNDSLLYRAASAPASVGRAVVVADYQGVVHWLSREDGSFVARTSTDGDPVVVAPTAFSAGTAPAVLVQTRGGGLFAFATD